MDIVVCSNCGKENPGGMRYCAACGFKVSQKESPSTIIADDYEQRKNISSTAEITAKKANASYSSNWAEMDKLEAEEETRVRSIEKARRQSINQGASLTVGTSQNTSFSTLKSIANLCNAIAWVSVILVAILGLLILANETDLLPKFGALILIGFMGFVGYVFWKIIAESILVILAIESNTRETTALLKKTRIR